MKEMLSEVFASIRMNRQRSILAGISTAWGIFMLIVLLGVGQGLIRGISSNYDYMSHNVMHVVPGTASMPCNGRSENRKVILGEDDARFMKTEFADVVSAVIPVVRVDVLASKGRYSTATQVCGVTPGYMAARYIHVVAGRDINELDIQNRRKVCVLSARTASLLLSSDFDNALGQYVLIGGIPHMVVGIYEPVRSFILVNDICAPLSTVTALWREDGHYDEICLFLDGLDTEDENAKFKQGLFEAMSRRLDFAPDDVAALSLEENMDFVLLVTGLLGIVSLAIWIVGILALASGIVGVGNIMYMSVTDRTYELGLRRIMGASDFSIMALVLLEAVITMLIFGYAGMMAGIGVMRLVSVCTADMGSSMYSVFGSMDVRVPVVVAANAVMIAGGLIAGWAPARHAVRMELAETLKP